MSNNVRRGRKDGSDPKMIGLWNIGRTIGKGCFGRVRIARHSKTGQYAAVKIISKSVLHSPVPNKDVDQEAQPPEPTLLDIEREIVIMKLIDHPNVLRLYDVWETSTQLYLILEYAEGGELFDYLCDNGKLSVPEALGYFQQIIAAIDYCHRFNIAHRDLKLENLLLDSDNNIKVADFGLAAWQGKSDLLQTACGSPHYVAPEVVMGQGYNGACSDVWSCGVILYILLAGSLPFDNEDQAILLEMVTIGKYTMPKDIDSKAKDLISKMLEKDPTKRITIAEIVKHPFYTSRSPKVMVCDGPSLDDIARPLPSAAHIDPDILANLRTLWPTMSDGQLKGNLTNKQETWVKGVYHLLVRYRAKRLENYDEEEEKLVEKRKEKKAKKKSKRVRIAEDLPPRTGPPTPRRAARRANVEGLPGLENDHNTFRQLTAVGSEVFSPEATSSACVDTDTKPTSLDPSKSPELRDERIQMFFQQIEQHLEVMQVNGGRDQKRNVENAALSPATINPPPPTPLTVNLGTPFALRTSTGGYLPGTDTFAKVASDGHGTRPLSIRRKNAEGDKENAPEQSTSFLTADRHWPERKSSLRSTGAAESSRADRHVLIVEPPAVGRSKLRKKHSIARSHSPSSLEESSTDGSSYFSSTPKRSWFGAMFRFGPAVYELLSTQDAYETRRECRQILENMGVSVMFVQAHGMGTLKCRLEKTRDPASVMGTVKPVSFRVEMRLPATVQAIAGYRVLLSMVMEKGAHSSFKLVFGRLRRDWVLDSAPTGFAMEGRAEDDDKFVEVVYAS